MKYLIFKLVLYVLCNICWALYPSNYYGQQQKQHDVIQQQKQLLQQQQQLLQLQLQELQQKQQQLGEGQLERITNLNIILPQTLIEDFEYIPTVQGYRFSYKLPDGSRREENAFITGLRMDDYARLDSKTTDLTAVGVGGRPKMKLKNRKLSPGSLKSLSG